jgi:hypothetical protein
MEITTDATTSRAASRAYIVPSVGMAFTVIVVVDRRGPSVALVILIVVDILPILVFTVLRGMAGARRHRWKLKPVAKRHPVPIAVHRDARLSNSATANFVALDGALLGTPGILRLETKGRQQRHMSASAGKMAAALTALTSGSLNTPST